jgi:hypothetical protein
MIHKHFLCHLTFTYKASPLQADCAIFAAHGGVATSWNGMTIPRRCALPCTPKTAHSTLSKCRI